MKAKSWKKFVKENPDKKRDAFSFDGLAEDKNVSSEDPEEKEEVLKKILAENETLGELVKEREQLEQQMARLTGQDIGGENGNRPFYFAEIPSIKDKKEAEKKREERRKRDLELIKKRQELGKLSIDKPGLNSNLSESRSNLSPIDQKEVISRSRSNQSNSDKRLKKKDKKHTEDHSSGSSSKKKTNSFERFDFEKNRQKRKADSFSFERNKKENERFSFERNKKENERFDFDENVKKQRAEKNRFSHTDASAERKKNKSQYFSNQPDNRFTEKAKKEEKGRFNKEKKAPEKWLFKDEKKRKKAKKTVDDLKRFSSEYQEKKKQLDKLNRLASDKRFEDAFDPDFKRSLSTASKLTDKLEKPFKAVKTNKAVEKFSKDWEAAKQKRLNANRVKEKYEKSASKMLKVNVGSFDQMQLRLDKLKLKTLRDKKDKEKEEERELTKREQRKKEREEERKRERAEEKKREKKEEERRERKREEKRRRKKDND